jgi:hypothetical protein
MGAAGFHARCPGLPAGCRCPHHQTQQAELGEIIRISVRKRLILAGIDPDLPLAKRGRGDRTVCGKGHDLTEPNSTTEKGECRMCRRDSSARSKEHRRLREEAAEHGETA